MVLEGDCAPMSETGTTTEPLPPEFELPNVGVGPDPLSLARIGERADFAILLLLRDYHCPKCKSQVQTVAKQAQSFAELNAVVVPVLPEPRDRAAEWQESFDLPFPLLADSEKDVAEKYDQPTRFGALGQLHDMIGRMPESVILDTRNDGPEVVYTYEGETPGDRPDVETLLAEVDALQESFVFDCDLVDC
jgi:peroxiredoxin Q/BCP